MGNLSIMDFCGKDKKTRKSEEAKFIAFVSLSSSIPLVNASVKSVFICFLTQFMLRMT